MEPTAHKDFIRKKIDEICGNGRTIFCSLKFRDPKDAVKALQSMPFTTKCNEGLWVCNGLDEEWKVITLTWHPKDPAGHDFNLTELKKYMRTNQLFFGVVPSHENQDDLNYLLDGVGFTINDWDLKINEAWYFDPTG